MWFDTTPKLGKSTPGFFIIVISGIFFLPPYLSFTLLLYGFLRRRVEEWEKVSRIGVL